MGLFDSTSPDIAGGLLGNGSLDPGMIARLGFAQGMLASSGASRLPVTMGAALANGIGGAMSARQSALQMQGADIQNAISQFGLDRQKIIMDAYGRLLRGGSNASAQALAQGAAAQPNQNIAPGTPLAGAVSQGGDMQMGGVGPTTGNAGRMAAMAGTPTDPLGNMTPPGMAREAAGLMMISDAPAFFGMAAKNFGMTDQQKNALYASSGNPDAARGLVGQGMLGTDLQKLQAARTQLVQQGVPEADPRVQQIDSAIAKANYVAPIDAKPGTPVVDPLTGRMIAFAPKLADGITGTWGKDASGVTTLLNARGISGYSGANAGIAGAEQRAKQGKTIFTNVTGDGGKSFSGFGSDLFGGDSEAAPVSALTAPRIGAATGAAQAPAAQAAPARRGVISGPSLTEQGQVATGQKMATAAQSEAANVGQYRQALNEIYQLAQTPGAKFGPGSQELARMKALASNVPGLDLSGAQTSQDVMRKLASNLVMSQLGQTGTGTDAQMEMIEHANPNGEMTNEAITNVVPRLLQQLDLKESRNQVVTGVMNGGDASKIPAAVAQFNRLASPEVVSLGRAIQEARTTGTLGRFMSALSPAQRAQIDSVIQLGQMGAF